MIGRENEKQYLQSLLLGKEPEFVAVSGRRGTGKTYLICESLGSEFTFRHTAVNNLDLSPSDTMIRRQLDKFAESLEAYGRKVDKPIESWDEAFGYLKELIKVSEAKRKVIFIDELSWMDTKGSGLLTALESFWNGFATARKQKDIILIVCSSATYWIVDNIVNSKGGLHNRLTHRIHLQPFSLKECEQYVNELGIEFNRYQIMQCYMALGGIPYYWSQLKRGLSLPQNIDQLFFEKDAALEGEYNNLYSALFSKPQQYIDIIEALCTSLKGLSREELSKKSGVANSGDFTRKLEELENCGFIRKYTAYGYKSRNCLYQLIDNYTLFYHKFLKDKPTDEHFWVHQFNSPSVRAWSGLAFERVCLLHAQQIKKALGIEGVYTEINAWSCKENLDEGIFGSQIDLLIVRKDQVINLCEMKYSENEYIADKNFDASLRRKVSDFTKLTKTKYAIHTTLIAANGVVKNSYSGNLQSIVDGDALFS
ncbi:MAG: ATP-binding protein [Erysipelotrichaceae bacterium]|nr:ATP-binding protein [Erysipelotrichaceae bacterium]